MRSDPQHKVSNAMFAFARTPICALLLLAGPTLCQNRVTRAKPIASGAEVDSAIVYTSPATGATQGYATDGINHYLFSTASIQEDNANWNALYSNTSPFAGLPLGVIHVGDGAYYDNRLYAPVEYFASCHSFSHQTIAVYTASTDGLPLSSHKDISVDGHEISSLAVVPSTNSLYASSFCDGSKLWIYDLSTLTLRGTLALSANIPWIQGISWNPEQNQFAVTADDADQTIGYIYLVSQAGAVVGPVYTTPQTGELEGVDYTQNTLRYLIGGYVYFLSLAPESNGPRKAQPSRH